MRESWGGSGRILSATGNQSATTHNGTAHKRNYGQQRHNRLRQCGLWALATASLANALEFTRAPAANLDLSQLGKIGIAGDFSGISLYEYVEQTQGGSNISGSDSLFARLPNGALTSVVSTDASIQDMCRFDSKDGSTSGVVIAGNFTSVSGTQSQGIALFDYNSGDVTPWTGLSGQVNAVYCDEDANTVYVGGSFMGTNSTNAISWVAGKGWSNLPFAGFNGPVLSIAKASNGHVIFGGSFTGLGNATSPRTRDGQVINLGSANVTSGSSSSALTSSDASAVICGSASAASGSPWLLPDSSSGWWKAEFGFSFVPTKLRLRNTHQDGRGTKTWRFTALPLNGILNFTYTDPTSGANGSCTSECPLSSDTSVEYQDFHFVNPVGMNAFQIDISAWYGSGGGLAQIELYSENIFAYAVSGFNEPSATACSGSDFPSTATATGPWTTSPSLQSSSRYLTAQLSGDITSDSASVVFYPDIRESGNYSVNIYTPGCLQDGTCATRARVNIIGSMSASSGGRDFEVSIFQTNNFEKYDQIYYGFVDAASGSFRPTVTITPLAGQNIDTMTFVAQTVGFTLVNSTGGLNGLYDFDPSVTKIDTSDFSKSTINKLGSSFAAGSAVAALAMLDDIIYVGGNFSSSTAQNIVSISSSGHDSVAPLDGGLNGEVTAMHIEDKKLYVGGRFSNTQQGSVSGLNNVGVYDIDTNTWNALGGGVDGKVSRVVPMTISTDGGDSNTTAIALTGDFEHLFEFGDNSASAVSGFAIWVPSQDNWLRNLNGSIPMYDGVLTASVLDLSTGDVLYAGAMSSSELAANGAVSLTSAGFSRFDIDMLAQANTTSQLLGSSLLAVSSGAVQSNMSGVVTGTFFEQDDSVSTILAGHFTARDSDGNLIQNLAIVTTKGDSTTVAGLPSGFNADSTFVAVDVYGTKLYAGGQIRGKIGNQDVIGLVSYDLSSKEFATQPPSLGPANSTVSSVAVRAANGDVYVGGDFDRAGSLGCPGVCYFSSSLSQWNRPGTNLEGNVTSLLWVSDSTLIAAGELVINSSASVPLASYSVDSSTWSAYPGFDSLPGAVWTMTAASNEGTQLWASGSSNGSVFLSKYDGSKWRTAPSLGDGSVIESLQVFSLSKDHGSSDLLDTNEALMLTGRIVISDTVAASAALFNGTDYVPYALTSSSAGNSNAGSISKVFTQTQNFFTSNDDKMPLVFVVLIGLAISLGLILLLVAAGVLMDRYRKKRDGYMPAPTSMTDRNNGIQRVPPHELLGGLNRPRGSAPQV